MKITKAKLKQLIKEELDNTMMNEGAIDSIVAKAKDVGTKVWNNVVNMAIDLVLESQEYEAMFDDIVLKLASAAGIELTADLKSSAQQLLKIRKAQYTHSGKDWSKSPEEPY